METLSWLNTMRDYYWELMHRNITLGMRIDPYGYNDVLIQCENTLAAKHREYWQMLYERHGLHQEKHTMMQVDDANLT